MRLTKDKICIALKMVGRVGIVGMVLGLGTGVMGEDFEWDGGANSTSWTGLMHLGGNEYQNNWGQMGVLPLASPTEVDNVIFNIPASVGSGSAFNLTNSSDLNTSGTISLFGSSLVNTGTINLNGQLSLNAEMTLSGEGEIVLNHGWRISGENMLTVEAGQTIRGQGILDVSVVNEGELLSDGGLTFGNGTGSPVVINNVTQITTLGGATTQVNGEALIQNGVMMFGDEVEAGILRGNGEISNVTLLGHVMTTSSSPRFDGTIVNDSLFELSGAMAVDSDVVFEGSGDLVIRSGWNISGAGLFTNGVNHTLRGHGALDVDMVNDGLIVNDEALSFGNGTGALVTVFNFNEIVTEAGRVTTVNGEAVVSGGVMRFGDENEAGQLRGGGELNNVRLEGYAQVSGNSPHFTDVITNNAVLELSGTMSVGSDVVFEGNGEIVLLNGWSMTGEGQFTNSAGHMIRGQGALDVDMVNEGSIVNDVALSFGNGTGELIVVDNQSTITTQAGKTTFVNSEATIEGGVMHFGDGEGAGLLRGNGVLRDVRLTGHLQSSGSSPRLRGTITNEAMFEVLGTMNVDASAIVVGSGEFVLGNGWNIAGVGVLTNGAEHTIRGTGALDVSMMNLGRIVNDGSISFGNGSGGVVVIDNTSGEILTEAGRHTRVNSEARIEGGLMRFDAGQLTLHGTLEDVRLELLNGSMVAANNDFVLSRLVITGGSTMNLNSSTMRVGVIENDFVQTSGTLGTQGETSTLLVNGGYELGGTGRLLVEIGGEDGGVNHDVIHVAGTLETGGTLSLELVDGFEVMYGQSMAILNAGEVDGVFDVIEGIDAGGNMALAVLYEAESVVVAPTISGDFTLDGVVNLEDLARLATNFGMIDGGMWALGDATGDGVVDLGDLAKLATNFGQSVSGAEAVLGGAVSIPEPGSLGMVLMGMLGLGGVRRRGR